MFIGHFALGMAAKKINQRPSLGTFFLAVQFLDLLWPFFLLAGWETVAIDPGNTAFTPLDFIHYPYSHSLLAALIWGALFGLVYYGVKRSAPSAMLLGVLVVSHWLLDFITHRPDLPLGLADTTKVGLGLWNQKLLTIGIELLLFCTGAFIYTRNTQALNRTGRYAWWALLLFLVAVYFMNAFGEAPPSAAMIGYVGLSQWLLIAWGYWIDNNRKPLNHLQPINKAASQHKKPLRTI